MRIAHADNIILTGMPGAGKSTVGVLLAKRLGYEFIDTDLLLQVRGQLRLQQMITELGMEKFKQLESTILCELEVTNSVIATGGSAVYSEAGMDRLRSLGTVIFIDIPMPTLQARISDMDSRGLVIDPGESFPQLFRSRYPLYKKYSDITIHGDTMRLEQVAAAIEKELCQHETTGQDA